MSLWDLDDLFFGQMDILTPPQTAFIQNKPYFSQSHFYDYTHSKSLCQDEKSANFTRFILGVLPSAG